MNTIGDMQNEMNFYDYCNEFEYNHDYVKLMKHTYIYISMYTKYNYMYMSGSILNIVTCICVIVNNLFFRNVVVIIVVVIIIGMNFIQFQFFER